MPKLSKEQVKEELNKINLTWVGNEYKNLDSLLTVECDAGHSSLVSIKKARKGYLCPTCFELEKALDSEKEFDILDKKEGKRILSIDGATYLSGYSIMENGKVLTEGVREERNSCHMHRIAKMRQWTVSMIEVYDIDYVAIEDVYVSQNKATAILLAKLLGVLENAAYTTLGVKPIIVPASVWKSFCGVKGKTRHQQKQNATAFVKKKYGIVATQDAVDAICIGAYATEAIKSHEAEMITF